MRFFLHFMNVPIFGFELSIPSKGLYLPGMVPSEHDIDLIREMNALEIEHFDFDGDY